MPSESDRLLVSQIRQGDPRAWETMIARPQMPGWMQMAARFNPVDWGVRAAREVVLPGTSWGTVALYLLLLLALSGVTAAWATSTFRSYQRSL